MVNVSTTAQTPHDLVQGGSGNDQFAKLVNGSSPIVELREGADGKLRLYTKDLQTMPAAELAKYALVTGGGGSVTIEVVVNG